MLRFVGVEKSYRDQRVLNNINFETKEGEITVLIGPSGCGKTPCLKLINRLIKPSAGTIFFKDEDISRIDPTQLRRRMGYVIQQTGLFPHMTVEENISIVPKLSGMDKEAIKNRVIELMEMIGLDPALYLHRYPIQLSGGQQQRIGVARAFALDPEIVLMDEPFSALDPITREQLQNELLGLQEKLHKSIVFVTHDMDEAIKLADKMCILDKGNILQFDTPEEILKNPCDSFVQEFVGANRIWSMPQMIRARDIMIETAVTCSPNTGIMRAVEKMVKNKVDSILVVDAEKELHGIIIANKLDRMMSPETKVSEIMESIDFKVTPDKSIIDLLRVVNEQNVSILPVVSNKNKFMGLITKGSLVSTLSRQFIDMEVE